MSKTISNFIKRSIEEDIGSGDITSLACIKKNTTGTANLIAKEPCIISGIDIARKIYLYYDKNLIFKPYVKEGEYVNANNLIFSINGSQQSILATERLVLNCMQRMSGITTKPIGLLKK